MSHLKTLEDIRLSDFDFIDFGAGEGASLSRYDRLVGGRGVGIEIIEEKARRAQSQGLLVVHGSVLSLPSRPCVRFITMDNFLEHLSSLEDVFAALVIAPQVAGDFFYIRHPSFEDEAYLRALGLKQYWTDWTGHPSHVLLSDFAEMFHRLGLGLWEIGFRAPISDSLDSTILPVSAPRDQHHYTADIHGPKSAVKFDKPVHGALDIYVPLTNRLRAPSFLASLTDVSFARSAPEHSAGSHLIAVEGVRERNQLMAELVEEVATCRREIASMRNRKSLRAADAIGVCLRARTQSALARGMRDLVAVFRRS